jgi:alkanesulfonate monooxygenase SsuD/methylene tetrahydromethanopterin reductase-like flavin-dependent oxidoreductase (luciferase family)
MKTGVVVNHIDVPLGGVLERARWAEKSGADSLWVTQTAGQREVGMLLAALAMGTERAALGTAVMPAYAHPPAVTAQSALTLDELSGGRLILGLGVGHRLMGEWMMGSACIPRADAMREYLTIIRALITDGEVDVAGRWYSAHLAYAAPRRPGLPLYLGALGPRMLELAGELADGVVLYLCTPGYLRDHVMPRLRAGWARRPGGRGDFDVVVMLFGAAGPDTGPHREMFHRWLAGYQRMDYYRRMLAGAGFAAEIQARRTSETMVSELAAIGSAGHVRGRIAEYAEAGATRVALFPMEGDGFDPARFRATVEAAAGA